MDQTNKVSLVLKVRNNEVHRCQNGTHKHEKPKETQGNTLANSWIP